MMSYTRHVMGLYRYATLGAVAGCSRTVRIREVGFLRRTILPKIDIDSIQFSLSLDACLREAASAKAGERAGVRVHYRPFYPPPLIPLPPGEGSF